MKRKHYILLSVILVSIAGIFLYVENVMHNEFFLHLAAIPIEILAAAIVVERLLSLTDRNRKRRRLMDMLFVQYGMEMSSLLEASFKAVESPSLSMSQVESASIQELKKLRDDTTTIKYKSLELIEVAVEEYVKSQHIWREYVDRAVEYDFEETYHNMMHVLYFIDYVELFKRNNPDELLVDEIRDNKLVREKAEDLLGFGIRKFLDVAIELRIKKRDAFNQFISNLEQATRLNKSSSRG